MRHEIFILVIAGNSGSLSSLLELENFGDEMSLKYLQ